MEPSNRLFIFGLGYSARLLAHRLAGLGWAIAGTARSAEPATTPEGFRLFPFARERPLAGAGLAALAAASHILSSVPPDEAGDPVIELHRGAICRHGNLEWVGYLSSTGVYGDSGGAWVDETSPVAASGPRGVRRAAAEAAWLELAGDAVPVHVFRLAGIYGPGRNALAQLLAGTARRIDKPGHVFSRIHVEDIASVLQASMARPNPGAVYNLCDDRPAAAEEVVRYAATLLKIDPPPLVPYPQADLSPAAASFYADNRRIRNSRIKRELGVELAYPDYEVGLRALLDSV
ncbi:MAG: SDR family oxidoreductase [Alphaproteobacteria bacterium]